MDANGMSIWSERLTDFRFPRYEELPDIELYMDQVISLLNKYLAPLYDDTAPVTASMINNYVKLRLLPPPEKKRYTRTHLAHLVVITVTKQVLPINDARALLHLPGDASESELYNAYTAALESEIHRTAGTAAAHTQPNDNTPDAVRSAVVSAIGAKMLAEKLLEQAAEDTTEPSVDKKEKGKKKD